MKCEGLRVDSSADVSVRGRFVLPGFPCREGAAGVVRSWPGSYKLREGGAERGLGVPFGVGKGTVLAEIGARPESKPKSRTLKKKPPPHPPALDMRTDR